MFGKRTSGGERERVFPERRAPEADKLIEEAKFREAWVKRYESIR